MLIDFLKGIFSSKKIIILGLFMLFFYISLFLILRLFDITPEVIRNFIAPFGLWGIIIVFIIQLICSLTPMPDEFMPMIATILYGPLIGFLTIWSSMLLGAVIHYFIGRRLGREYIITKFPQMSTFLEKFNNNNSVTNLIYIRMFSFISFDITSYVASIANIRFRDFFISAALGLITPILTPTLAASGLVARNSIEFVITWLLVFAIITLLAYFYKQAKFK